LDLIWRGTVIAVSLRMSKIGFKNDLSPHHDHTDFGHQIVMSVLSRMPIIIGSYNEPIMVLIRRIAHQRPGKGITDSPDTICIDSVGLSVLSHKTGDLRHNSL
jgi:hypothetical protein